MRNLTDTLGRISAWRAMQTQAYEPPDTGRLQSFNDFGDNPGALHAYEFVPANLGREAPLVVVLHGCLQSASAYDGGTGWTSVAEKHGFALLFPEQARINNPNKCFNWFNPEDSQRNSGEPASIIQMVEAMVSRHNLDRGRVFVTGLSAGGAMTSILMATCPDIFAGGAIIAGLPFGTAGTVPEAFDSMRGSSRRMFVPLLEQEISGFDGRWPKISVWHGDADTVVVPSNADDIVQQWLSAHELDPKTEQTSNEDGFPRRYWSNAEGVVLVEDCRIPGMGHGTPRDKHDAGASSAYMLDVDVSSTRHIARFWGLVEEKHAAIPAAAVTLGKLADAPAHAKLVKPQITLTAKVPAQKSDGELPVRTASQAHRANGLRGVIENALRAAGLMR